MSELYHFLTKKSTVWAFTVIFLLLPRGVLAKAPNDPSFAQQRPMFEQINALSAWDTQIGSRDVVVAIIDAGVDTWHDDLRDNIWHNPYEIEGNGKDDDNNGYTDDINGWNFIENNNDVRTSVQNSGDDPEAVRHGTIVAGLVGAVGDNKKDGAGVAWSVKIMPLRAINSSGSGAYEDVAQAITYAVKNGADIIVMSFFGTTYDESLKQIMYNAYKKGVVLVVAAGNSRDEGQGDSAEYPDYPVCFDSDSQENWILGVSSVDSRDRLSRFANYGKCVDILAPGEKIYSSERYAPQFGYEKEFGGPWYGTSFAAPLVGGAAALLKSAQPEWGAKAIINQLLSSARKVDEANLRLAGRIGAGVLDAGAAVQAAGNAPQATADFWFYYLQNNYFKQYNPATGVKKTVASLEDKIISFGQQDFNDDGAIEHALLVQRPPFYYLRLLKDDGSFWLEFPVGDETLLAANKAAVRSFRFHRADSGAYFTVEETIKGKNPKFIFYDTGGARQFDLATKEKYAFWDFDGGNLLLSNLVKGKLSVKAINRKGQTVFKWEQAKADKIYDFLAARLSADSTKALALMSRSGKLIVVGRDLATGALSEAVVGNVKKNENWRLFINAPAADDLALFMVHKENSGIFSLFSGDFRKIETISLPKM